MLLLGTLAALAGCRPPAAAATAMPTAERDPTLATALDQAVAGVDAPALRSLLRRHWALYLERWPLEATRLGVHAYDERVDDVRPESYDRDAAVRRELLAELAKISAGELSGRDRVTAEILREQLEIDVAGEVCRFHLWSVSAAQNPVAQWNLLPELQPVREPAEADKLLARYRKIAGAIDQTTRNLGAGLREGRVASAESVRRVLAMVDAQLAEPLDAWPLLAPAREERSWAPEDRQRFAGALRAVVEQEIRPALTRYAAFLRAELLPAARPPERTGVGALPEGPACYASQIRKYTSLPLSADEVHATGLKEVARIDAEIAALGEKLFGARELPKVLARLREDPQLYFASKAEIVAAAEAALAAAEQATPKYFGIVPRARCVVREVPDYEAPFTTIAYYRAPVPDGSKPGEYFVNTDRPETRPRFEARVLAVHESVPGHHLQIAIAQELPEVPDFRRHAEQSVYVEGWALYTERLGHEMGLYESDLDRMGVLSFAAWRASRLVVDTGLHHLGWSRAQAERFLQEHTALALNNISNEVDRYIGWPGQALAYKTGELELLRLRRQAEDALGERFDLRAFHDAVLGGGPVPLPVLRRRIEALVAASPGAAGAVVR